MKVMTSTISEPLKALVAVADGGDSNVILRVWPSTEGPEDPWGCEFDAVGSRSHHCEDIGLACTHSSGFWVWEGSIRYPGPNSEGICEDGPEWRGHWRRALEVEVLDFLYTYMQEEPREPPKGWKP